MAIGLFFWKHIDKNDSMITGTSSKYFPWRLESNSNMDGCHVLKMLPLFFLGGVATMEIFQPPTGWWFGTWFLFFHMLGIIIPTDELIFFRGVGLNHQPDIVTLDDISICI